MENCSLNSRPNFRFHNGPDERNNYFSLSPNVKVKNRPGVEANKIIARVSRHFFPQCRPWEMSSRPFQEDLYRAHLSTSFVPMQCCATADRARDSLPASPSKSNRVDPPVSSCGPPLVGLFRCDHLNIINARKLFCNFTQARPVML